MNENAKNLNKTELVKHATSVDADSFNESESNSTAKVEMKRPFPFGLCKICGDQATGVHYGIETCEGCKVSY